MVIESSNTNNHPEVLLKEGPIHVLADRVLVGDATHMTTGITRVDVEAVPRALGCPFIIAGTGCLMLIATLPAIGPSGLDSLGKIIVAAGVLTFLVGVILLVRTKRDFAVSLRTGQKEIVAIPVPDRAAGERVAKALSEALARQIS